MLQLVRKVPRWIDALQQAVGGAPVTILDCGLEDDPLEIADRKDPSASVCPPCMLLVDHLRCPAQHAREGTLQNQSS
jgi:hypothetical protein